MRKPMSFRLRLAVWVAGLAALGLAAAGGLTYLVELARTDSRLAGSLERAAGSLYRYAEEHADLQIDDLIDGAVGRSLNADDECTIGRPGADGPWTHAGAGVVCGRVLADARLLSLIAAAPADEAVRVRHLDGDLGNYAYVAVPVIPAPDPDGGTDAEAAGGTTPDAASSAAGATASGGMAVGETASPEGGVYAAVIDRGAQRAEVARSYLVGYLPVGLGAVALVTAAGWAAASRILRPLRKVAATATQIAAGPGGRPDIGRRLDVDGPAEAVELAGAMNTMLDALQAAFESQRQLLDDVGHELRTPLTVIQGHLELMDQEDLGDVTATRALALDELARMRRLTDSLVTLAAVDGPDFAKLTPLALGPWFDELVDKARGLGERQWIVAARDEAWALADRQRLTEAMLELATNAVKHSPEGSAVAFALRREGAWVRLAVRDQGRGIDPADQRRVFKRFARAAGAKRDGGAGLGLAIVAKIAAAHGGRVEVRSNPGEGAEFALWLPALADPARTGDGGQAA
ncbi:MAG: HAMP domain-containing histidine kinase [Bifidobacteriaceae bacterium]|jgi:signal transduction histidine kinase|nr:HAMP domain-containing histidine kinase [Bifidobacteriaceae bacterium]